MRLWFVLDMDEGVLGAYSTRRAALADFLPPECPYRRHKYGPGAYEYQWHYPGDVTDGESFFLEQLGDSESDQDWGWSWATRAWVKAGRPMGRLAIPCGREDTDR